MIGCLKFKDISVNQRNTFHKICNADQHLKVIGKLLFELKYTISAIDVDIASEKFSKILCDIVLYFEEFYVTLTSLSNLNFFLKIARICTIRIQMIKKKI